MARWIVKTGKTESEPLSGGELRAMAFLGQVGPDTLVRQEGTQRWVPASAISGLEFGTTQEAPAPSPPVVPELPPEVIEPMERKQPPQPLSRFENEYKKPQPKQGSSVLLFIASFVVKLGWALLCILIVYVGMAVVLAIVARGTIEAQILAGMFVLSIVFSNWLYNCMKRIDRNAERTAVASEETVRLLQDLLRQRYNK